MNKSLRGTSQKALRRLAKTSRVMKNFNVMWDGSDGRDLNMEDVSNLLFNKQDKIIKDEMQLISEKEETVTLEFPQQGLTADIPIEINKDPEPHSSIHYELFESEPVDEFCQFQSDDSNSNYDTKEMLDSDDSISSDDIDTGFLDDVSNSLIASLLTTAMYLKFGLSTKALEVQLKIMKVISPSLPKEFRSTYLFLKKISNKKEYLQKVFLCDICSSVMAMDFKTGNPLNRQNCGHFYSKFTHSNCYTILLPVEEQLKFFIEHHLQNSSLASKPAASVEYPEVIGDICTGAGYQKYKSNGLIDDYTVTIQLNTDGAQIHKSSKYGFWPFMGTVNETSYKTRRSNVLLFALYYGNKKPNIANFIDPVVQQLKQLSSSGIVVNGINWKVRPIVITVDTVARPILRNTTQFNGEYGCDFCLYKGISSKKLKGHCRSYRIPSEDSPPSVMRTTTQHINDLEKLLCAQASGDMKRVKDSTG